MKNETSNTENPCTIQNIGTRFFRGDKMILDDDISVIVIYKAGDYVHIDKGNENWTSVHYCRLS